MQLPGKNRANGYSRFWSETVHNHESPNSVLKEHCIYAGRKMNVSRKVMG